MNKFSSQPEIEFKESHKKKKRWLEIIVVLSCIVVFCTTYALILPAITLEQETYCGIEEHTHTEECYETVNVCGYGEATDHAGDRVLICGHEGDEDGEIEKVLVCDLSEEDGHVHNETCYEEVVTEPHVHTDSCYHIHTEECFKTELVCEKSEHEHILRCYSNPELTENPEKWEESVSGIVLTDVSADNLVAVAESQLGYTESTENYVVAEDGETIKGYTRYGDWYANEYGLGDEVIYGEWDSAFVSFCLNYAGVDETYAPRDYTAAAMLEKIKNNITSMTYVDVSDAVYTYETAEAAALAEASDSADLPADENISEAEAEKAVIMSEYDGQAAEAAEADVSAAGEGVYEDTAEAADAEPENTLSEEQNNVIYKGDLVFFDKRKSGLADSVGIVKEVNKEEGTVTVIQGDDGDCVTSRIYNVTDETIVGFGKLLQESDDTLFTEPDLVMAAGNDVSTIANSGNSYPLLQGIASDTKVVVVSTDKEDSDVDKIKEFSGTDAFSAAMTYIDDDATDYINDYNNKSGDQQISKYGSYVVVFTADYTMSSTDVNAFNTLGSNTAQLSFTGTYTNGSNDVSSSVTLGSNSYYMQTTTGFHHMAMVTASGTTFYGNGNDLTMDTSVTMTNFVRLYGGSDSDCTTDEDGTTTINVLGGKYSVIAGGNNGAHTFTGNIYLYCESVIMQGLNGSRGCIYAAQECGDYFTSTNVVEAVLENIDVESKYYNKNYTDYGYYCLYDSLPPSTLTEHCSLDECLLTGSLSATVNVKIINSTIPYNIDCRGTNTTLYVGGCISTTSNAQSGGEIIVANRMEVLENSSFYQGVELCGDAIFKIFVVRQNFVIHDNASYHINTGESIDNWYVGGDLVMESGSSLVIGGSGSLKVNGNVIVTGYTSLTLYAGYYSSLALSPLCVPNGSIRLNDNGDFGCLSLDVSYLGKVSAGTVLVDLGSKENADTAFSHCKGARFTIKEDTANYDIEYGTGDDLLYDLTYKETVSISQMLEDLDLSHLKSYFSSATVGGSNVTVNFANDVLKVKDTSNDFYPRDNYITLTGQYGSLTIYLIHAHVISAVDENVKIRLINYNTLVRNKNLNTVAEFVSSQPAVDGTGKAYSSSFDLNVERVIGNDGSPDSILLGSLAYLFNPDADSEWVSEDYTINGNTGLFQRDSDGNLYYDSQEASAYYNGDTGKLDLFDYKTVRYNSDGTGQSSFYPFNLATTDANLDETDSAYCYDSDTKTLMLGEGKVDFWFAMNMKFSFIMPTDGKVSMAAAASKVSAEEAASDAAVSSNSETESDKSDMIFKVRSSDDCLVYIDGVLVASISGESGSTTVTIDFATGDITGSETTTLRECYNNAGKEGITIWSSSGEGNTYAAGTSHTLEMYTTERNGDMKDFGIWFNGETATTKTISVTKTVDTSNLTEEEKTAVESNYTDYAFIIKDANGNAVANQQYTLSSDSTTYYTDSAGKFSLKDGETATFEVVCGSSDELRYYTFTEEDKSHIILTDKKILMNTPVWTWTVGTETTDEENYSVTVDTTTFGDSVDLVCKNTFSTSTLDEKTVSIKKEVNYDGMPDWVKGTDGYANQEYTFTIKDSSGNALTNKEYELSSDTTKSYSTDGNGKFKLKDGETATFKFNVGLASQTITLVEDKSSIKSKENEGYKVSAATPKWKLGETVQTTAWTYSTLDIGTESGKDSFDVTCLNSFTKTELPYKLEISKTVIGQTTTGEFNFELTVKNSSGKAVSMTSKKTTLSKLGVTIKTDTTNVLQFSLADGESVKFNSGSTWIIPKNSKLTLTETNPDGYVTTIDISDTGKYTVDTYTFDLDKARTVAVVNTQGTVLPKTGGRGTLMYIIGGLFVITGVFVYGYILRRRRKGGG